MTENKTKPTDTDVQAFIAQADPKYYDDCQKLIGMMSAATGEPAKMWGTSIVGFGTYHYKYDSGRQGDSTVIGFSPRKPSITLYLMGLVEHPQRDELLAKLGKHTTGKGCIYIKKLADVDTSVLQTLMNDSVTYIRQRYPKA